MLIGGMDLEQLHVVKTYLFGSVGFLDLLVLAMILDIITGTIVAFKEKNLWSRKAMFGYMRKILILTAVVAANILDQVLHLDGIVAYGSVIFYIGVELLSVVENLSLAGVLVPKAFAGRLRYIKEKSDNLEDVYKEEFTDRGDD